MLLPLVVLILEQDVVAADGERKSWGSGSAAESMVAVTECDRRLEEEEDED